MKKISVICMLSAISIAVCSCVVLSHKKAASEKESISFNQICNSSEHDGSIENLPFIEDIEGTTIIAKAKKVDDIYKKEVTLLN